VDCCVIAAAAVAAGVMPTLQPRQASSAVGAVGATFADTAATHQQERHDADRWRAAAGAVSSLSSPGCRTWRQMTSASLLLLTAETLKTSLKKLQRCFDQATGQVNSNSSANPGSYLSGAVSVARSRTTAAFVHLKINKKDF